MANHVTSRLFVYGTLRAAFGGAQAARLSRESRPLGQARLRGQLVRIADYPGLVIGGAEWVYGDLVDLADPAATLAWIDAYEECSSNYPLPHEYRREIISVEAAGGTTAAWTYIYARPATGLPVIDGGDFLACAR